MGRAHQWTATTIDDVESGRRLPFSRAFAQEGFSREESEAWRRAGWTDPAEAGRWRDIAGDATPAQLRALADDGYTFEQVARASRLAPSFTSVWTRALTCATVHPVPSWQFDDADHTIDIRDAQEDRLQPDVPRREHALSSRSWYRD